MADADSDGILELLRAAGTERLHHLDEAAITGVEHLDIRVVRVADVDERAVGGDVAWCDEAVSAAADVGAANPDRPEQGRGSRLVLLDAVVAGVRNIDVSRRVDRNARWIHRGLTGGSDRAHVGGGGDGAAA